MRLRRLCLFIFKRRFFLRLPIWYLFVVLYVFEKKDPRLPLRRRGRKTGNNLLSHGSEAALPSATEGLTSVFGMESDVFPLVYDHQINIQRSAELLMALLLPRQSAIMEKNSLTSGNASAVRKNSDYDEWSVSDH